MAIPGEKAIQMVRSAHAQAVERDIAVTAVVVDQSGRLIALGRMDRARPITVEDPALHGRALGQLPDLCHRLPVHEAERLVAEPHGGDPRRLSGAASPGGYYAPLKENTNRFVKRGES
jgi:hypothetical protein